MMVAALVRDRPFLLVRAMPADDHVVVVPMVVAVDVDMALTPLEIAAVVLDGHGGRSEDQGNGEQGRKRGLAWLVPLGR